MFQVNVNKNMVEVTSTEPITSGSQNVYVVEFTFSEEWETLEKTAVFRSSKSCEEDIIVNVLLDETNRCMIPWEVMESADSELTLGVFGVRDGSIVLPTVWAEGGIVLQGVTTGKDIEPPTPSVYEQILSELAEIKEDISGGGGGDDPDNPSTDFNGPVKTWWSPKLTKQTDKGMSTSASGTNAAINPETGKLENAFGWKAFDNDPNTCFSDKDNITKVPEVTLYFSTTAFKDYNSIPKIGGFSFSPYKGSIVEFQNAFPKQISIYGKETGDSTSEFKLITVVDMPEEKTYNVVINEPTRYRDYQFAITELRSTESTVVTIGDILLYGYDPADKDRPMELETEPIPGGASTNKPLEPYSLQESVVGTWIDGRPIYQAVVYLNQMISLKDGQKQYDISAFYNREDSWGHIAIELYSNYGMPLNGRMIADSDGNAKAVFSYTFTFIPGGIQFHVIPYVLEEGFSDFIYAEYAKIRYIKYVDNPNLVRWSPKANSNIDPYPIVGTEPIDARHDLYMAFDGNDKYYYAVEGADSYAIYSAYLMIDMLKPVSIYGVSIDHPYAGEAFEKGLPTGAELYGSNDGETWEHIAHGESDNVSVINPIEFSFSGNGCYTFRYYKFTNFSNQRTDMSTKCYLGDVTFMLKEEDANGMPVGH